VRDPPVARSATAPPSLPFTPSSSQSTTGQCQPLPTSSPPRCACETVQPTAAAPRRYRLAQCGVGASLPGFRVTSEASLAAVWIYTRCYMHYTVLMAPMIARVPYDSGLLLAIHGLMWAMFALQLYWGAVMLQKAVLKFVMGKKDVTKLKIELPTKGKSPKSCPW
jgi:hypothetical protein